MATVGAAAVRRFSVAAAESASAAMAAAAAGAGKTAGQRSLAGRLGRGFLALTAVSTLSVGAAAYFDPGTARSLQFWYHVMPIYAHYRWVQWKTRNEPEHVVDAEYNVLHELYAGHVEKVTLDLKGFYLKQAQLVSTRDEFLPEQYMKWCKKLQSEVPTPLDPALSRAVVERSLGRPLEEVFSEWDDEPIGAASIGQVHRARLRKDGRVVAVKVQYPGIEHMFRSDIKTTIAFCKFAMPQHVSPMQEIEKQFLTEFDYRGEASNLKEIHDAVMPVWGHVVNIPEPIMDLCTREVLVMEYMEGKSLITGVRDMYRDYAAKKGTTLEALEAEQKAKIKSGEFKFQAPEEQAAGMRRVKRLLKVKDALVNAPRAVYNGTLGWFVTPLQYKHTQPPINLGEIMQTLMAVHAWEIFQLGSFNGDPHPGNIMLLKDGRLGLVDYGQVKRMNLNTRIEYAKLIIALSRDDRAEIIRLATSLGGRTKYAKPDILYRLTAFWNDRDTDDVTGGRSIQTFMEWAQAEDPLLEGAGETIMAARVSVLMRGMGLAFGMRMATSHYFRPFAEQLLRDNGIEY